MPIDYNKPRIALAKTEAEYSQPLEGSLRSPKKIVDPKRLNERNQIVSLKRLFDAILLYNNIRKDKKMANGTVKWFNSMKGYGFIEPEDGTKDVFVHVNELEKSGLRQLKDGQKVSFEVATNKGRTSAVDVKVTG